MGIKYIFAAIGTFLLTSGTLFDAWDSILNLIDLLYPPFLFGIKGWMLLIFRVSVGILFVLHGFPKLVNLRKWAKSLKMPADLCFLSALSMFLGGFALIVGFLTPLASLAILFSMGFATFLHIKQGEPFVGTDPYLLPEGQYEGPKGKSEPPSFEKAFMYDLMLLMIIIFGPGGYSLDAIFFAGIN